VILVGPEVLRIVDSRNSFFPLSSKLDVSDPISNQISRPPHRWTPFFEIGRPPSWWRPTRNRTSPKMRRLISNQTLIQTFNVCFHGSPISQEGDVRFQKKGGGRGKRAGYNPWDLWSDPCGARLAPGLKPLRLPGALESYGSSPPCRITLCSRSNDISIESHCEVDRIP